MIEGTAAKGRKRSWTIQLLALFTILFFGGGGALLIVLVQHRALLPVLIGSGNIVLQIALGISSGLLIGSTAWWIIRMPYMEQVRIKYADLIGPMITRRSDRIWISICAGVGEELFFRGALQYWLGIPVTAILFVAIHGYLDPRDRRIFFYGAVMTIAMMGLGWLADSFGLMAPMIAHALIDIILLERLHMDWRNRIRTL